MVVMRSVNVAVVVCGGGSGVWLLGSAKSPVGEVRGWRWRSRSARAPAPKPPAIQPIRGGQESTGSAAKCCKHGMITDFSSAIGSWQN